MSLRLTITYLGKVRPSTVFGTASVDASLDQTLYGLIWLHVPPTGAVSGLCFIYAAAEGSSSLRLKTGSPLRRRQTDDWHFPLALGSAPLRDPICHLLLVQSAPG